MHITCFKWQNEYWRVTVTTRIDHTAQCCAPIQLKQLKQFSDPLQHFVCRVVKMQTIRGCTHKSRPCMRSWAMTPHWPIHSFMLDIGCAHAIPHFWCSLNAFVNIHIRYMRFWLCVHVLSVVEHERVVLLVFKLLLDLKLNEWRKKKQIT